MNLRLILIHLAACATLAHAADECSRTASYRVYSNAFYSEESGDVGGYELAIGPAKGNSVGALLYVYEGVPNMEGISLAGIRQGSKISFKGDWHQELIEYPSKQMVTKTQHVELNGQISQRNFRGLLQMDDYSSSLSLRTVSHIWLCKSQHTTGSAK